jgi:RNA polymerase sigma-70 factor (ECF subfamily)
MQNETDDAELWQRALDNDGDAFAELFDRHRDRVYRRAQGLLTNSHDAEDVTAAVFFELWRRGKSVRLVSSSVLPWLLVTTVNLCRNSHRSTARYRRLLSALPRVEPSWCPDGEQLETRARLAACLRQLSPADAALFVLTAIEDVPISQAAEALGIKASTARMRLHRAKARLRTELHDLNPTARPAIEGNQP